MANIVKEEIEINDAGGNAQAKKRKVMPKRVSKDSETSRQSSEEDEDQDTDDDFDSDDDDKDQDYKDDEDDYDYDDDDAFSDLAQPADNGEDEEEKQVDIPEEPCNNNSPDSSTSEDESCPVREKNYLNCITCNRKFKFYHLLWKHCMDTGCVRPTPVKTPPPKRATRRAKKIKPPEVDDCPPPSYFDPKDAHRVKAKGADGTWKPIVTYNCLFCDRFYIRKIYCLRHEQKCNKNLTVKRKTDLEGGIDEENDIFECDYCDLIFRGKQNLQDHMKECESAITGEKYVCSVCSAEFPNKEKLEIHREDHVRKRKFTNRIVLLSQREIILGPLIGE